MPAAGAARTVAVQQSCERACVRAPASTPVARNNPKLTLPKTVLSQGGLVPLKVFSRKHDIHNQQAIDQENRYASKQFDCSQFRHRAGGFQRKQTSAAGKCEAKTS